MSAIEIVRVDRSMLPVLHGFFDGKPLTVRLDCSANLKLRGSDLAPLRPFDPAVYRRIVEAVERIVTEEMTGECRDLEVTVSALDLA